MAGDEWPQQDLNLRPTDYESAALTAELRGRLLKSRTAKVGIIPEIAKNY